MGYGKFTSGGRGGQVVFVTTTNDSGPGSLRNALEVVTGPRIVIFKVGGVLKASNQIEVRGGNVTVAGQTAPGNGFVVTGARIRVVSSNVIIRGLKVRPGDGPGDEGRNRDAISVGTKDSVLNNVVIDHNSLTWAVDETLTAWYKNSNLTFSYNLIAEPLYDSIHIDEGASEPAPHGMGTLIGDDISRISILRNIYSSCNGRNPLARGTSMEFSNNYVYNYGSQATQTGGSAPTSIHILNNYYQEGPQSSQSRYPIFLEDNVTGFDYYVSGNLSTRYRPTLSQSESAMIAGAGEARVQNHDMFTPSGAPLMAAADVVQDLSAKVGSRWPVLDAVDSRIIQQTKSGTGRRIDSPSQVGGLPSYPSGTPAKDTDQDGIPDSVETMIGSNAFVKDDSGDADKDGFTNIEEYAHGVITGYSNAGCGTESPTSSLTPVKMEVEAMQLTGFEIIGFNGASNRKYVQSSSSASAKGKFAGGNGVYDISVIYFDENDGESKMSLRINGVTLKTWTWNKNLGDKYATTQTRTSMRIAGVPMSTGDVVELIGRGVQNEPLRTDVIQFEPK
jgi:pectate lyase